MAARPMPEAWAARLARPAGLFSLDAYAHAGGTEIVLRPELGEARFLGGLDWRLDGATVQPLARPAPRGTVLRFEAAGATLSAGELDIDVAAEDHALDGCNVLFAIVQNPDPDVLRDWLDWHVAAGADAALLIHRDLPDTPPGLAAEIAARLGDVDGLDALVWVACPVPLGHPELGPETARHYAADAPGKALLEPLPPDPWRAPLAEVAIYEAARRRFLSGARAVLHLAPSDLLAPGPRSVFDAAAEHGYLRIAGRRAYPYALRDGARPRHGDHQCRAFDGSAAEPAWCVGPARLGSDVAWRQFRLSGAEPAAESAAFSYDRCMAIRHPGLKAGELAPKTSLVQDRDLARLSRLGGSVKEMPEPPPVDPSAWRNDRVLVVTTMKNEGPFILDWLAWHRAAGVTDFLVYTNDCTDGTDAMFDLLAARGLVEHRDNPYRETGEKPQHAALLDAGDAPVTQAADWIICMDVDEYIDIHVGDGTLHALFDAVPEANFWSLTWRLFGNGDVDRFVDRPVVEQFRHCAPEQVRKPHQAWGFKTLFRNAGFYKKLGVHRPKGLKPECLPHIRWVNGSGKPMPEAILRSGWRSNTGSVGYDLVTLNHYALRSAESFLVKRDRGRVNHVDRDQGLNYWFRMNHNAEESRSAMRLLPRAREEKARLLSDPEIAAAHAGCVAAHRARIAELLARPDYAALHAEITGERLRALSRMLHHFGTEVFLKGPGAVPEDFHLRDFAA